MNDKKIRTLDDVRAFLAGTTGIELSIEGKDARYRWIEQTLRRLKYRSLARRERGLVLRYLERVSGYSRQTVTRLVTRFMYLVAIMDWHSRRVLSWRLSNTLDTDFCIEALEDALQRFGAPDIFNTDQGSRLTCEAFTGVLKDHGIAISMDGKGRWVDNVFVERLWRSVKYEDVYLRAYAMPTEFRAGLARYFAFYNTRRRRSALDRRTPDAVYFDQANSPYLSNTTPTE